MKNEHKKTPKPGFGVFLFALFAEQHTVALDIELLEQIADGEVLLFLTAVEVVIVLLSFLFLLQDS